ncbi:DUF924 family protein [Rhizobium sp. L1K21]|uniref:DUF924 family protein n=1 Tax=Rhizobium sp. L1K21 TaxID=2954933 RepID=UPI00209263EF|nr:DUF924 family protein [Rhizobium sp. L1K21]MCO6185765.1 DUF924 domain-containing protein [Rhizobium sp. L1K21]
MQNDQIVDPEAVIEFWFSELSEEDWFVKNEDLDRQIERRFGATHRALLRSVGPEWHENAETRLAAIIVLDQFSRNIYRDTPYAFAADPLGLREARLALELGADAEVHPRKRLFFYLPFEHSENMDDQNTAVRLCEALGNDTYLRYAEAHRDVIAEFGRFPHRNSILARPSTKEELEYLAKPDSGF